MNFDVLTIMPQMFDSVFSVGIMKKAIDNELVGITLHNLRDYVHDKHKTIDDTTYGGGVGMVFKPEPIISAIEHIKKENACTILLSAQGQLYTQEIARDLLNYNQIVLLCCRYEGCDERVAQHVVDRELSIGNYIVHGGEVAAMVIIESVSRLLPGVVGKEESIVQESFSEFLLDYPHYTKPALCKGLRVPKVLLSGDHEKIRKWRIKKALEKTIKNRPDLMVQTFAKTNGEKFWHYIQEIMEKE